MINLNVAEILSIYPSKKEVVRLWIVRSTNDGFYRVNAWDEKEDCTYDDFERLFPTWEDAQAYIIRLLNENPDVFFIRNFGDDVFETDT